MKNKKEKNKIITRCFHCGIVVKAKKHTCGKNLEVFQMVQKCLKVLGYSDTFNSGRTHFSNTFRDTIANKQDGWCAYCTKPLGLDFHIDHVYPISRGGSNELSNLVATCPKCNLSKHDKHPTNFIESLEEQNA